MIKFNVKVDLSGVKKKADEDLKRAQFVLDQQVVKDSNFYAPVDRGTLMDSALIHTNFGSGEVVWSTPYARRLYFNPEYNFSKDKNPNAQGLWFEVAKTNNSKHWVDLAQKAANGKGE